MKYAKDTRPEGASTEAAKILVEALPWIKNITGKTVVIKYGGSAMVDEKLRADVMSDIVLLKIVGVKPRHRPRWRKGHHQGDGSHGNPR